MDELAFRQLCRGVARCLGLAESEALLDGELVEVEGVRLRLWLDDDLGRQTQLQLVIGAVRDEHKIEVYEALLAMQGAMYPDHQAVFDFDGLHEMLCCRAVLPISAETSDAGLATVIRLYALQVLDWQRTLLAGRLLPQPHAWAPTACTGTVPLTLV